MTENDQHPMNIVPRCCQVAATTRRSSPSIRSGGRRRSHQKLSESMGVWIKQCHEVALNHPIWEGLKTTIKIYKNIPFVVIGGMVYYSFTHFTCRPKATRNPGGFAGKILGTVMDKKNDNGWDLIHQHSPLKW